jgi:hypothetical protein
VLWILSLGDSAFPLLVFEPGQVRLLVYPSPIPFEGMIFLVLLVVLEDLVGLHPTVFGVYGGLIPPTDRIGACLILQRTSLFYDKAFSLVYFVGSFVN